MDIVNLLTGNYFQLSAEPSGCHSIFLVTVFVENAVQVYCNFRNGVGIGKDTFAVLYFFENQFIVFYLPQSLIIPPTSRASPFPG